MGIETVSNNGFDIAVLEGALTVSELASLTPALSLLLQEHPKNSIVLDMSKVTAIDTSTTRLFQNIKKKMDASSRKLYLLNPASDHMDLLGMGGSATAIQIIKSIAEIQQNVNSNIFQHYLPFVLPDDNHNRLRLTCGICGSSNVYGYLINKNDYEWRWPTEDYFPECIQKSGEPFDYFSKLPIICTDCLTTSIDVSNFNLVDENNTVVHHSIFKDQIKLLLSKTIKKRKKILEEVGVTVGDTFFNCPRNRVSALYCYLLAESCARIAAINISDGNMFTVGLLNYISLLYCEKPMKPVLIDNCRTFLTQVIASPEHYNHVQLAQAYYIIFVSSLSLGKFKELSKIMESYTELMDQAGGVTDSANNLESPAFWYNRANEIWKNEISKKSSAIVM